MCILHKCYADWYYYYYYLHCNINLECNWIKLHQKFSILSFWKFKLKRRYLSLRGNSVQSGLWIYIFISIVLLYIYTNVLLIKLVSFINKDFNLFKQRKINLFSTWLIIFCHCSWRTLRILFDDLLPPPLCLFWQADKFCRHIFKVLTPWSHDQASQPMARLDSDFSLGREGGG